MRHAAPRSGRPEARRLIVLCAALAAVAVASFPDALAAALSHPVHPWRTSAAALTALALLAGIYRTLTRLVSADEGRRPDACAWHPEVDDAPDPAPRRAARVIIALPPLQKAKDLVNRRRSPS